MKKAIALLLALVMVFALAACGGSAKKSDGVYWLNFKPESDEVLQQIAKMYKEKTGVDVKVVTAASGTYSQTLTAEMDKSNPPPCSSSATPTPSRIGRTTSSTSTAPPSPTSSTPTPTTSMTTAASWSPSATASSATASSSTPTMLSPRATAWMSSRTSKV